MQTVFRDEVLQILIVYLDDIIVFSQDIPEHLRRLEIVLKKLREHGLKLELSLRSVSSSVLKLTTWDMWYLLMAAPLILTRQKW